MDEFVPCRVRGINRLVNVYQGQKTVGDGGTNRLTKYQYYVLVHMNNVLLQTIAGSGANGY